MLTYKLIMQLLAVCYLEAEKGSNRFRIILVNEVGLLEKRGQHKRIHTLIRYL